MGVEIILYIQQFANPFFDIFFEFITMLGEAGLMVVAFMIIYYAVDKKSGQILAYTLFLSICLNGIIKDRVKAPRPFDEEGVVVRRKHTATGYSFPSGHSQSSSTFFITLSQLIRRNWVTALAVILSLLVGISRLYLGVHYPIDVLGGLAIGTASALIGCALFRRVSNPLTLYGVTWLILLPLLLLSPSADSVKSLGLFTGALIGLYLEQRFANFTTDIPAKTKLLRCILGFVSAGILMVLLKLILPAAIVMDGIRYALIGVWVMGVYPVVFTRMKF